jgi:glycerate dehydrogenase
MKIVVLDGHTLEGGDLDWSSLRKLGNCTIYDRTTPGQILERTREAAAAVLTNKVPFTRETIFALPQLKYIGVTATGTNVVDLNSARERGIVVTNVPAYSTASVAQAAFGHLLNLAHGISHHASSVRTGRWANASDWCYWDMPLVELSGRTLGIIGFGEIGQQVAKIGAAFGMNIITTSRTQKTFPPHVSPVSLETLFRESDAVTLHCSLNEDTRHIINAQRLATMKHTAFLINTSRGGLVDEQALADALNEARIAGAGLDVLSVEPPSAENPLLIARNCFITPHLAWATRAARERLLETVVENLRRFIAGTPINMV